MQLLTGNRPLPGVLFGITHNPDGAPIIREAKVLKVGIGVPKGRGLHVWIHNDGKWYFQISRKGPDGKVGSDTIKEGLKTRQEAEDFYRKYYKTAEVVSHPRKLGYFTFTRAVTQQDGSEVMEPDFDAIEAHGPTPREIDVVFLDDNPFDGAYQMWSTSQLKCRGDGVIAERVLEMAATDQEKALADLARKNGQKYFPIINGCALNGCSYQNEVVKGNKTYPSPCKPGGDLKFQLANNIRVGGTAYFHTTAYKSISWIFSSLERIKALTGGRVAGIPLKMVLRPYKTSHNGQAATQYGVRVEFRAQDIQAVRKNLIEQAWKFRELAVAPLPSTGPQRYLAAPGDETPAQAQAMADEYYPSPEGGAADDDDDYGDSATDGEIPASGAASSAESATNAKTAALADKLAKKKQQSASASAEPAPAPAQNAATPETVTQEEDRDAPPEDPEDPRFQRQPGDMI